MAVPIKGMFANTFSVPYANANVWGTGYNAIHAQYGSPPTRLNPYPTREGEHTPPWDAVPQSLIPGEEWGYTPEDNVGSQYFVRDDRPSWDIDTPEMTVRQSTGDHPSWNATGAARSRFRSQMGGAFSKWRGKLPRATYEIPDETVSEGWINKPTGRPANARVSDPSQYEIQTSMTQRYRARNNDHAVARGTDPSRSHINSRVSGTKVKVYSQGDRIYDMEPREQSPNAPHMSRDFYYRTAGTGVQSQMQPNAMYDVSALERTPPPTPYIGQTDVTLSESPEYYGYQGEDQFYA
jgi:hypothetical protein